MGHLLKHLFLQAALLHLSPPSRLSLSTSHKKRNTAVGAIRLLPGSQGGNAKQGARRSPVLAGVRAGQQAALLSVAHK